MYKKKEKKSLLEHNSVTHLFFVLNLLVLFILCRYQKSIKKACTKYKKNRKVKGMFLTNHEELNKTNYIVLKIEWQN